MSSVSATLFVKDHRMVAEFYCRVVGASISNQDDCYTQLDCVGFSLMIHQIRVEATHSIDSAAPSQRRECGVIRLNFAVRDIEECRHLARQLGGQVDDRPPPWAEKRTTFFLGHDPEGNIIGCNVG